jgi:hypothetical protein
MTTARRIKEVWDTDTDLVASAFAKALTEFGYGVTKDYVKTEIQRLLAGGEIKGGPSSFIKSWLDKGTDN